MKRDTAPVGVMCVSRSHPKTVLIEDTWSSYVLRGACTWLVLSSLCHTILFNALSRALSISLILTKSFVSHFVTKRLSQMPLDTNSAMFLPLILRQLSPKLNNCNESSIYNIRTSILDNFSSAAYDQIWAAPTYIHNLSYISSPRILLPMLFTTQTERNSRRKTIKS